MDVEIKVSPKGEAEADVEATRERSDKEQRNDPSEAADDLKESHKDESDDDDDDEDLSCGLWKFRTTIFGKWFSNLYVFAFCVGIAALFTAMVTEIIQVQLPSLERQFNIDNAKAGLFDTAFKAGYLCTILLAGHFTKKAHIPVIVGISGMTQGLMLLIPPILQFVDPYELPIVSENNITGSSDNERYVCRALGVNDTDSTPSSEGKEVNRLAYNVLIGLQLMKGVTDVFHAGFLPAIYIDDNLVDKSKMGIMLGIQSVFQMLASPLGREINGIISELPIDLKKTDLTTNDHRFVSAWWLGFLIFGIGTAVFSIPVLLFPRRLVSKKKQRAAERKVVLQFAGGEIEEEVEEVVSTGALSQILNSDRKVSIVLTAPDSDVQVPIEASPRSYRKQSTTSHGNKSRRRSSVFPPLSGPTERKISLTGDIVFEQPVKAETPDNKEGPQNSLFQMLKDFPRALYRLFLRPIFLIMVFDTLVSSVPWAGMSFFRSTYIASEYNVPMSRVAFLSGIANAVGNTAGTIVSSVLSSRITTNTGYVLIIFFSYFIATFMTPLYLIFGCDNQSVYGTSGEIGVPVNTSALCDCENVTQLLSCGADGNNYFSPCHAGCLDVVGNLFTNCSLLANHTGENNVSPGICATDCDRNFLIYVFVHGLQNFVTASCVIAYKLLILRTVEPRDRAFAISIYIFFFNLYTSFNLRGSYNCGTGNGLTSRCSVQFCEGNGLTSRCSVQFCEVGIPAPNVIGRIMDQACYVSDGEYCALYDRTTIRHVMAGLDVSLHGFAQVTSLMMLCYFKYEDRQTKRKNKKKDDENPEIRAEKPDDAVDGNLGSRKGDSISDSHNVVTRL